MININYPDSGQRQVSRDDALRAAFSWYQSGQIPAAEAAAVEVLKTHPQDPDGCRLLVMIQISTGRSAAAVRVLKQYFDAVGSMEPALSTNLKLLLARAFRELGEYGQAMEVMQQVVEMAPEAADAHAQLGIVCHLQGELTAARDAYAEATRLDPGSAPLQANLAAVLMQLGDAEGAGLAAGNALDLDPKLSAAFKLLGCARAAMGDLDSAREALEHAVARAPEPDAWYQLGMVLEEAGDWDGAYQAHRSALSLKPDFGPALSESLFMARRLCQWAGQSMDLAQFERALDGQVKGLKPFSYLSQVDLPRRQQRCAQQWATQIRDHAGFSRRALPAAPWRLKPADRSGSLTVGFLSSGFHRHPTACLTAEFFECLDREKIRPVAFSTGPDDRSGLRGRIVNAMDRFHDLAGQPYPKIRQAMVDERVDILMDLRGYGGGAVSEVLVSRPAPIQVNWLAYPGTMGTSDFVDYIVLDPFIASDEVLDSIDEAPLILPHSYQPTDTTREFAHRVPTRSAAGLPDSGVVFASFNNSYKFSPPMFDVWMEILRQVPNSVLWLLAGKPGTSTDHNLRREAQARGIDPGRLIMMPKRPHLDYLAHLSLADLFLDTVPYNAHTTASDALWAGCPVLTCAGRSFAARVAGSLLSSAGLQELVTSDLDQYRALAVSLGQNPEARASLKEKVQQARSSSLFDTPGFCRHMETAWSLMAQRAAQGLRPAAIDLRAAG